jgi:hypothetical protein
LWAACSAFDGCGQLVAPVVWACALFADCSAKASVSGGNLDHGEPFDREIHAFPLAHWWGHCLDICIHGVLACLPLKCWIDIAMIHDWYFVGGWIWIVPALLDIIV